MLSKDLSRGYLSKVEKASISIIRSLGIGSYRMSPMSSQHNETSSDEAELPVEQNSTVRPRQHFKTKLQ